MSDKVASYRRILKTSSIIGGSSVVNILIGLIRTKVLAILLGPAGVGLVSLYTGLLNMSSAIATMGISSAGARQIALATSQEDDRALALVRRSMFWFVLLLATAGALLVWSLREVLAIHVLGNVEYSSSVGWLSLGVALSVASSSQVAIMSGMRRIGDMAKSTVHGSIWSTVLGVLLLWRWGQNGLIAYVLSGPMVSYLIGHWYVSRLPKMSPEEFSMQELAAQWKALFRLGVPLMGAGVVGLLMQLWIRAEVGGALGAEALGHFQAAWTISVQYIGFVLAAMGADYYPRLTGVIHDHKAATSLVNDQTEIALLLSAPVFIVMIGLTPWIVQLLYSSDFLPATDVLHWLILGDMLKVLSWPLGYVLLAAGATKAFFWTESLVWVLIAAVIAVFSSRFGLQITGIAFLVCYMVLLPLLYYLARIRIAFRWSASVVRLSVLIFFSSVSVWIFASMSNWGALFAFILSFGFAFYALMRIAHMSNIGGFLGRFAAFGKKLVEKIGSKNE